jgi:hypothetical protein
MDIPEIDIEDDAARREALFARFGTPSTYPDTAGALRLIGKRDEVHPDEAVAFTYPSRECAEAFAASNLKRDGVPSLGLTERAGAWLGVLDLRPCYATSQSYLATDPSVPDDGGSAWRKQQRELAKGAAVAN